VKRFVVDASTLLSATVARREGPLAVLLEAVTRGAVEIARVAQAVLLLCRAASGSAVRFRTPHAELSV
jgi:hypothetical protein